MTLIFFPHEDDLEASSLEERLEALMDAAERYKAAIFDASTKVVDQAANAEKKLTPKDAAVAFNWDEIVIALAETRQLPEATSMGKLAKAEKLAKLAEIYEVLRSAKMPKLESVRVSLVNESNQLRA